MTKHIAARFGFTISEVELLIEALEARASRHESMARANPFNAARHDRTAEAMRRLRARLIKGEGDFEAA